MQKELIKTNHELHVVKNIDELHFKASKPSWVFSTLFGRDIVQDWFCPVETPPKNAVKERSWELPKISVDDFLEIFINSPFHPHDKSIFKEFELVLDYLVHGILERPGKHSKSNIPPFRTMLKNTLKAQDLIEPFRYS